MGCVDITRCKIIRGVIRCDGSGVVLRGMQLYVVNVMGRDGMLCFEVSWSMVGWCKVVCVRWCGGERRCYMT